MGGKAPAVPPAPDPVVTANAQADANIRTAERQQQLNSQTAAEQFGYDTRTARQNATRDRVNQTTPFGSLTYANDPNNPDAWSSNVQLSPEMQQQLQRVYASISQPVDLSSIGATQDTAANALLARLNPSLTQQRSTKEAQLRNQGLTPGTPAWENAFRDVSQTENDARLAALSQAGSEADRAYSRYMGARAAPLNEFLALSGADNFVNVPGAPQGQTQVGNTNLAPTDYLGAVGLQQQALQSAYQAKSAAYQSNLAGLYGIGSALVGGAGRLFGGLK